MNKLALRHFLTKGLMPVGVLLATLAAFGFVQTDRDAPSGEPSETAALAVETVRVDSVNSFAQRRTFTGVLKAARTSELGFERTGRLIAVEVSEGDRVEQGQVLAQLDAENLKAKQQELTAQRQAARSLLQEFEAGPRKESIDAARAEVRDLQSQVELADLNYKRRERLLVSRATSQEEYENASLGLQSTRAKLDAAQRRLDELEAGTRAEQIDAQRAVVAQLDAALANIAIDLEESTLRAPFAGMIGKRYFDEGTIVATGAPLLRIVEDERLEAWIGLPVEFAAKLQPDETVIVLIAQQEYAAKVQAILPELDPATRTRTAIFRLEATAGTLPAQVARIEIEDSVEAEGFWVPTAALARGSRGLWSVLVAEHRGGGEKLVAAKRDVEILHTDGLHALVRGTLQSGDEVIVSGTHRVVAGQAVTKHQIALLSEQVR